MTMRAPEIDFEQIRQAAALASQARQAASLVAVRVHQELIAASQKAAEECFRMVPPEVFALAAQTQAAAAQIHSVAAQARAVVGRVQAAFRDGLGLVPGQLMEWMGQWQEAQARLPARIRDDLQVLGEHGWYIDVEGMTFPEVYALVNALRCGGRDADDAHEQLCQHFESRMDEILDDVATRFPCRVKILRSAFAAHSRGEYELSVPALLAQTDGICKQQVGVQLWRRRNGRLRTAVTIESWRKSDLRKAMLHPFLVVLPIAFNEDERDGLAGILNRHAVLHGEDVTYATRRNGCRAISLLAYVASMLRDTAPDQNAA